MSIKQQIMEDIKSAMKNKESDKVTALRMVTSAIKNREIEVRPNELSEDDVMGVLKKLVKQRKDSIEQFAGAGRDDLAQKESEELSILEAYLPQALAPEKVKEIVTQVIGELGATEMKQMGAVMKMVLEKTGGAADNKLVSQFVKEMLGS